MSSESQKPWVAIFLSLVGLASALGVALISNWDKFNQNSAAASTEPTMVQPTIETPIASNTQPIQVPQTREPEVLVETTEPSQPAHTSEQLPTAPVVESRPTTTTQDTYPLRTRAVEEVIQQPESPRTAKLVGKEPGSRVNLRPAPSVRAESSQYGLVGDTVTALDQTKGDDGYTWHFVRFPSKATGWIRDDFIEYRGDGSF